MSFRGLQTLMESKDTQGLLALWPETNEQLGRIADAIEAFDVQPDRRVGMLFARVGELQSRVRRLEKGPTEDK